MSLLYVIIPTLACLGYGIYGMVQHYRDEYEWHQCGWLWVLIITFLGAIMGLGVLAITKLIGIS